MAKSKKRKAAPPKQSFKQIVAQAKRDSDEALLSEEERNEITVQHQVREALNAGKLQALKQAAGASTQELDAFAQGRNIGDRSCVISEALSRYFSEEQKAQAKPQPAYG